MPVRSAIPASPAAELNSLFYMRLKEAEPIQGEFAARFRSPALSSIMGEYAK